ncbi:MAG: hypothetical protein ACLRW4_03160 [Ruminococcus sp.]
MKVQASRMTERPPTRHECDREETDLEAGEVTDIRATGSVLPM